MYCSPYTVHWTLCTVHSELYTVHCTLYAVTVLWLQKSSHITHQFMDWRHPTRCYWCLGPADRALLYTIQYVLYSIMFILLSLVWTVHCTLMYKKCALLAVLCIMYILHNMHCTVYFRLLYTALYSVHYIHCLASLGHLANKTGHTSRATSSPWMEVNRGKICLSFWNQPPTRLA